MEISYLRNSNSCSRVLGRETTDGRGRQQWHKRLLECTLQDLIAIYMPHMILYGEVIIGACYIYDPTLRLLLYSALPERYQSWPAFTACLLEEMRLLFFCAAIAIPVLQLQVISFDLVNTQLEAIVNSALTQ